VVPAGSFGGMPTASDGLDQVFAELGGPPSFDADFLPAIPLGAEQPRKA
jgi:hypothetical protein